MTRTAIFRSCNRRIVSGSAAARASRELAAVASPAGRAVFLTNANPPTAYWGTYGAANAALRHLVEEASGLYSAVAVERPLLAYYANAIAHLR